MKLRMDSRDLAAATSAASKAINAKPVSPALAGMVLAATEGELTFSAFDYDVSVTATTSADVAEFGSVVLPGKQLASIAATLPTGDVDLALDGGVIRLNARGARYGLALLSSDDYPTLPVPPAPSVQVDAASFSAALARTSASLRPGDRGAYTSVVRAELTAGRIDLVTTDGYTLSHQSVDATGGAAESIVVDVDARSLYDAAKGARGTIDLGIDDHLMSVATPGKQTTLRLTETGFPAKWRRLIPVESSTTVTVACADMIDALERCLAVVEMRKPIELDFGSNGIRYRAGGETLASLAGDVAATAEGDPLMCWVNPAYLLGVIKATPAASARLALTGPRKPVVVTPVDVDGSTHLVMPVQP